MNSSTSSRTWLHCSCKTSHAFHNLSRFDKYPYDYVTVLCCVCSLNCCKALGKVWSYYSFL
jgi:hypothetical protein